MTLIKSGFEKNIGIARFNYKKRDIGIKNIGIKRFDCIISLFTVIT